MADNTIERRIAYDISGGSKTNLLKVSIKVDPNNTQFSIQFIFSVAAGGAAVGRIQLTASNDGVNFYDVPDNGTVFTYKISVVAGTAGGFIFVGSATGVSAALQINARYVQDVAGTGIIGKAIFSGVGN